MFGTLEELCFKQRTNLILAAFLSGENEVKLILSQSRNLYPIPSIQLTPHLFPFRPQTIPNERMNERTNDRPFALLAT